MPEGPRSRRTRSPSDHSDWIKAQAEAISIGVGTKGEFIGRSDRMREHAAQEIWKPLAMHAAVAATLISSFGAQKKLTPFARGQFHHLTTAAPSSDENSAPLFRI